MELVAVRSGREVAGLPLPTGAPAAPPAAEGAMVTGYLSVEGDLLVDEATDPIGAEVAGLAAEAGAVTAAQARFDERLAAAYLWGAAEYAARCGEESDAKRREWGARGMLAELAVALRLPEGSLARRLTRITMLAAFPRLQRANRAGRVSAWHCDTVLDAFRGVTDRDVLARADEFLAERARRMTAPELRASARGWRGRHVPRTEEQHARAVADRFVDVAPADDDMCWLTALLPASAAMAIYHRVSDLAAAVSGPDERRTLPQLRADVLAALLLDPAAAVAPLDVGAGHGAGACDDTAEPGHGDDAAGPGRGDGAAGTCHSDDTAEPSHGDDAVGPVHSDEAAEPSRGDGDDLDGDDCPGDGREDTQVIGGSAAHLGHGTLPDWLRGIAPTVVLTVPVLSLLGRDDEPADLEGFGPVDLETARALCGQATSFLRVLTDPETGTVLSVGRDLYRIPADLRRAVELRDRTCRFPGCRRRARRCDVDHSTAWPKGRTELCNLACLCRKHHRLKHRLGWAVSQDAAGGLRWRSPAGRRYRTEPGSALWPPPPRSPLLAEARCSGDPLGAGVGGASPPTGDRERDPVGSRYPEDPPY